MMHLFSRQLVIPETLFTFVNMLVYSDQLRYQQYCTSKHGVGIVIGLYACSGDISRTARCALLCFCYVKASHTFNDSVLSNNHTYKRQYYSYQPRNMSLVVCINHFLEFCLFKCYSVQIVNRQTFPMSTAINVLDIVGIACLKLIVSRNPVTLSWHTSRRLASRQNE